MAKVMKMPKIGVNMTEGTIMEWIVSEGGVVREGDHILTAETDKATQEIYAVDSGILVKQLAPVGQIVKCQEPVAVIAGEGESISEEDLATLIPELKGKEKADTGVKAQPSRHKKPSEQESNKMENPLPTSSRIKISPLAKKIAKELGINYSLVPPARHGNRITKQDVEAYAQGMRVSSSSDTSYQGEFSIDRSIPISGIRKTIAERMTISVSSIPRAVLNVRVDAERLIQWHDASLQNGNKVSYTDLIIKTAAKAIVNTPLINARIIEDRIVIMKDVNIGVAIDTERGLMVPVIHKADTKGIKEIHKELREKAACARSGTIHVDDLQYGTFTITNLGALGIEQFIPIINPPECAILAVGAFTQEPAVDKESKNIIVKTMFWLSLAFDHRIIDGAPAGRFLMNLKNLMEWPLAIVD